MYENEYSGKAKLTIDGIEYIIWTYANVVRKYVRKDLKKRFPGKIIARELNSIDYTIPELNIPVEIAATISTKSPPSIKYKLWENSIRNQIEQNIVASGICLLYFDSELLRALQNAATRNFTTNISINMDWFIKYIKEERLQALAISHDGIVNQKYYNDFDFLTKISQTCPRVEEGDNFILNKNKMHIYTNVMKGYGFIQEEIEQIEDYFENYCYENYSRADKADLMYNYRTYLLKSKNERSKLYGKILYALDDLSKINKILCREIDPRTYNEFRKYSTKILGIFDIHGMGNCSITRFVDKFDVCKYFPGYIRNKHIWNRLKRFNFNPRQFENIVTGENDVINGYISQRDIENSWTSCSIL